MALPVFESNEFDKDGNFIDGPLHPKRRNELPTDVKEKLEASGVLPPDDSPSIEESFDARRKRLKEELAALDKEEETALADAEERHSAADSEKSEDEEENSLDWDPGEYSVEDIINHVKEHPEDREAILAAEENGKKRKTVIAALTE